MTCQGHLSSNSSSCSLLLRLLCKWKGSVYKILFRDFIVFLVLFNIISQSYQHLLSDSQKEQYEDVVKYIDSWLNLVPLTFLYTILLIFLLYRWTELLTGLPSVDNLVHSLVHCVEGREEKADLLRCTLVRWSNLSQVLLFRSVSRPVRDRFISPQTMVDAGLMTESEKDLLDSASSEGNQTHILPTNWIVFRLQEAVNQGKIIKANAIQTAMKELYKFRSSCELLLHQDSVSSVPLAFCQLVTLVTYLFFGICIIGRQKLDGYGSSRRMPSGRITCDMDIYFPLFTIFQLIIFIGILRIAEQMMNPFGRDEDDFEINFHIDRIMKASIFSCTQLASQDIIPGLDTKSMAGKTDFPYTKGIEFLGSADEGNMDKRNDVPQDV